MEYKITRYSSNRHVSHSLFGSLHWPRHDCIELGQLSSINKSAAKCDVCNMMWPKRWKTQNNESLFLVDESELGHIPESEVFGANPVVVTIGAGTEVDVLKRISLNLPAGSTVVYESPMMEIPEPPRIPIHEYKPNYQEEDFNNRKGRRLKGRKKKRRK